MYVHSSVYMRCQIEDKGLCQASEKYRGTKHEKERWSFK